MRRHGNRKPRAHGGAMVSHAGLGTRFQGRSRHCRWGLGAGSREPAGSLPVMLRGNLKCNYISL